MNDIKPFGSKATIVVIDGNGSTIERITRNLTQHGYGVHGAVDVQDGLELISDTNPELVLLDYQLAGPDTPAVVGEIRDRFPAAHVVISIPRRAAKKVIKIIGNEAVECIFRPWCDNDLVNHLDTALRMRELALANKTLRLEIAQLLPQLETCQLNFQQLLKKKTESLHKAHFEIAQTEKLAAVGFLAAGMAHDIRNPLNSISLFTQLMRQNTTEPDQKDYLGKIIREVEKIDSIIRRLLDVSHCKRNPTATVRIDRIIDDALEVFSPKFEAANIRLERRYNAEPPPIKADPGELEQIFTNLFLNAIDEMPGGGRLGVEISIGKGTMVIRIEDSGGGIPEHVLPNIFDPFFTTKPRGTGMGLPVVRRIARLYGGAIEVEQTSSQGTVLRLEFPINSDSRQPGQTPGGTGSS